MKIENAQDLIALTLFFFLFHRLLLKATTVTRFGTVIEIICD